MENQYEILQSLIEKMEIVTVGSAVSKTKLNRKEIIDFVRSQHSLRIFDEENQKWSVKKLLTDCLSVTFCL